jgi:hypothetical protein
MSKKANAVTKLQEWASATALNVEEVKGAFQKLRRRTWFLSNTIRL